MAKKKTPSEGTKKVNNPNVMGLHAAVVEQPITDTLEQNYMPYAMSVIVSRAIPEIDGFKPSHRKLLYTMYKMGLLTGARTKSANIVGQTMRLNPHGDAAIYDTLVRLSKGYGALLHPFVDSKGNFGKVYSRDMVWAASRYTEAKLAPICQELFRDIDQDTVDFVDNYDNSMKEPALLPTTFHGEECNFSRLLKYMQSADRNVRRDAFQAWAALYEKISPELDEIYDELVHLRHGMAMKLGFPSFTEMAYLELQRYDYSIEDAASFRRQVREAAVLHDLQQQVPHVLMGLLDLVEEHQGVGPAANLLRQLAPVVVTHVAWRRSHQAAGGVALGVLRHVEADESVLLAEHGLGQAPAHLRLAHAGGAQQKEAAHRAVRLLEAHPAAANGAAEAADRLLLAHHPAAEDLLQVE